MTSRLQQQKCEFANLEIIDTQQFLNSVQLFFQNVPDPRSKKNCTYSYSGPRKLDRLVSLLHAT